MIAATAPGPPTIQLETVCVFVDPITKAVAVEVRTENLAPKVAVSDVVTGNWKLVLTRPISHVPEDVLDVFKKKVSSGISDSTILEWLSITGNETPMLIKFVHYKPTVSSQELMDQGFKGKELGLEIKRLEIEKFKQMI